MDRPLRLGIKAILTVSLILQALVSSAEVNWLETTHNFGAFRETDGPAECKFRFVNTGEDDVVIIAARANCGCTTPQYSRETILPGDTATISVAYNPAGRPGRFKKYIQVSISGEDTPQRLSVYGTVIGDVSSVGTRFPVDFGPLKLRYGSMMVGKVDKGRLKTATVDLYNSTSDSLRPEFTGMPDYVDVALVPEVIPPGEQATMMAYFRSEKCPTYGLVETKIDIIPNSTDTITDPIYSLPLTAIVNEDFSSMTDSDRKKAPVASVDNNFLDFGVVDCNALPLTGTLILTNKGKSELKIRRIYTTDRGVDIEIDRDSVAKNKQATISVRVDPSQISGKILNARISLITNDPVNPVQTIRVVGQMR